jgi:hypothetical protein
MRNASATALNLYHRLPARQSVLQFYFMGQTVIQLAIGIALIALRPKCLVGASAQSHAEADAP